MDTELEPGEVWLACPKCGDIDRLKTIERIPGVCVSEFYVDAKGERHVQPNTDIGIEEMDGAESVGVICDCGWAYEDEDWLSKLVPKLIEADASDGMPPPGRTCCGVPGCMGGCNIWAPTEPSQG